MNVLVSFIVRHHKYDFRYSCKPHVNRTPTKLYCDKVFTYDDFSLTSIVPPDKLNDLKEKLSKQQNSSVIEVKRHIYRIGNTTKSTTYKYIHSTNVSAMVNATLDEKFKELAEPLLDLELVAKTIEDWSRPLPPNYLTQPLVFVGPSGVGKGKQSLECE